MTCWVIFFDRRIIGSVWAADRDDALDIACMRFAGDLYEPGDDSRLTAHKPEDA